VRIQRLAGDEQSHDLTRSFKDRVDAAIAEETFDRLGFVATRAQRVRRFVAAPAANLHRVVHDLPRGFSAPQLAQRGLEPDVGMLVLVHQARGVERHRFHGKRVGGHAREFVGDGGVFANGAPHCSRWRAQRVVISRQRFDIRYTRRARSTAGIQCRQRNTQPLPSRAEYFRAGRGRCESE
jgi:hypothetical protein